MSFNVTFLFSAKRKRNKPARINKQPSACRRPSKVIKKEDSSNVKTEVLNSQLCADVEGCALDQCQHVKQLFKALTDMCSANLQSSDCCL